jgi:hypothetical protein
MSLWEDHYGIEVGQNMRGMRSGKYKTNREALGRASSRPRRAASSWPAAAGAAAGGGSAPGGAAEGAGVGSVDCDCF